jgi:hypothetical protein
MFSLRTLAFAALLTSCWGAAAILAAEDALLTIKEASVGFGGKFKAGYWQPVHLRLTAGPSGARGALELLVADGDQAPTAYLDPTRGRLDLAPGEERSVLLYAKSGPISAPITVQLKDAAGVIWSQQLSSLAALRSTQEWMVSLGPPLGLEEASSSLRRRSDGLAVAVNVRAVERLPDRWWGYDGVDVLVVATSDAAFLAAMSADQQQAIVQWVLLGGRIVLCVGRQGVEIASANSPWAALIPGELSEVEPLRDRTGLENYTKVELPFNEPFFQRNRPLVTRLKNFRGEVLLDEAGSSSGRPVVIRAAAGLGQVTFVGLDLDHPALKDWKGRTRLLAALVARGDSQREQGEHEVQRGVTHLGYEDLIGQLRSALDRFAGVSVISFTTVTALIIAFLLLISPGDYLFLSRLGLPRHWTWITFPALAITAVVTGALVNRQAHGTRPRLNQVEIIDLDLVQKVVRGSVWGHVYSPTTRQVSATLEVNLPPRLVREPWQGWLTWQGLPGDSLGGLESRQPALISRNPYGVAAPNEQPGIEDLVIPIASSKSLSACWWAKADVPGQTKLSLDRYGLLAGEFIQPFDVPLTDCLLAHGEKLYRLAAVAPGQRVQMAELPPLNLEARLTQRRIEQSKDVSTPWEKDSVEIPRIMQLLMFHDAARGRSYTGLTHRYQPQVDLSDHVRLGQAVLVGRARDPVARLVQPNSNTPLVEPADATTFTWYRIVFPVNRN